MLSRSLYTFTLTAALAGCGAQASPPPPPPPQVTVSAAIERSVDDFDEFTGRLEAVDVVEIRPRVAGLLQRVAFREGAEVQRGDVLFTIDARPFQAQLDRARAELARVRSRAELAHSEVERSRSLVERQAVSREEFDVRVNTERESAAAIAGAEAAVRSAALELEWTQIRAPISGRIGRADVTEGNLVQAGPPAATLLTTIVSLDSMFVYFDTDERAYLKYGAATNRDGPNALRGGGLRVRMALDDGGGFSHNGRLDFVDNRVDPATGTIRARAVFSNSAREYAPGLFARVRLMSGGQRPTVLVRDGALGTDQDRKFVLVLKADRTLEYRVVQTGRLVDGLRAIASGVAAGEQIVVNGLQRVRPGARVTPKVEPMAPSAADSALASRPASK